MNVISIVLVENGVVVAECPDRRTAEDALVRHVVRRALSTHYRSGATSLNMGRQSGWVLDGDVLTDFKLVPRVASPRRPPIIQPLDVDAAFAQRVDATLAVS